MQYDQNQPPDECLNMKLLIISPQANAPMTDAARVFLNIGYELQKRGHSVSYYLPRETASPLFRQTAELEEAIRIAPDIAQECRHKRYDVVIAPHAIGWCLATFRKWFLPRKTKIVSWHSGQTEFVAERAPETVKCLSPRHHFIHGLNCWATRQAIKTQDGFFFTSLEERDWTQKRYPLESRKALYLPNGVSTAFFFPERHEREEGNQRLLSVGHWPSGVQYLSAAFTSLHAQYPTLQLSIVNAHAPADMLLQSFPPNTHERIRMIPDADEKTLTGLYQAHDILILPPSTLGPPLTLLEGMASALPIVASNGIGCQDLISHYQNGLLIPPNDENALIQALSHLLDNPELCRQLGLAAHETASLYYTWRQVSDIFEEKLRQILHNKLPLPDWMIVTSHV